MRFLQFFRTHVLSALTAIAVTSGAFFHPFLALPAIIVLAVMATLAIRRRTNKGSKLLWFGVSFAALTTAFVALAFALPSLTSVTRALWGNLNVVAYALVAGGLGFVALKRVRSELPKSRVLTGLISVIALIFTVLIPVGLICNANDSVVALQMRHDMEPEMVPLAQSIQDRMLPQATAETYVQNLNVSSNTTVDRPHLQLTNKGELRWQSAVHQCDRLGRILQSVSSVIAIDAAHTDQSGGDLPKSEFLYGDHSWLYRAEFAARHPFSSIASVHYYQNPDGTWSILTSFTSKKPSWSFPALGTMVPYYAGVMEVNQTGWVRDHSPVQASRRFAGAVLYPAQLFRAQCEAYAAWHGGWTGAKLLQNDALEVSEDKSEDAKLNPLPYVQHFEGLGLQLAMPFEPKGDKQWALVEILLADASTGKLRQMKCPTGLIGPRQARLSVRSSDTKIDWSHIRKVEPRLVVAPRGIFWLVAIVSHWENEPDRHPYVTSVLVDAQRSSECYTFEKAADMRKFLAEPPPAR